MFKMFTLDEGVAEPVGDDGVLKHRHWSIVLKALGHQSTIAIESY